jgi:hypothetical protein
VPDSAPADRQPPQPPEPPADLLAGRIALPLHFITDLVFRIFPTGRDPLWFGPAPGDALRGRFDDPKRARPEAEAGATFGVCYLGDTREAAFAESFLRRPGVRLLSRAALDARELAEIAVTRPLMLVQLFGPGLAVLGATAAVSHGPHDVARRWARALWLHPDQPDGIAYRCRHDDDELAIALFDRARDALVVRHHAPVRADRAWFGQTLDRYRLALED